MDPVDAVEVANANRDVIVGIKVRVGRTRRARSGTVPLDIALEVAEEAGMPLMATSIIRRRATRRCSSACGRAMCSPTRSGRSPTRRRPQQGTVKGVVIEARKRGVMFDIGHGKGSFAFKTARAMLANGFMPDTISSDVHALCIDGPAFDQVTTMSKFLCLGMPLTR